MENDLDRRVTIERPVSTKDATYGGLQLSWQVFDTVWAKVEDLPTPRTELVRDQIAQVRNQVQVTMRYRAGLTPDMRLILRGTYDRTVRIISGPHELGRHERILLICEEYSS